MGESRSDPRRTRELNSHCGSHQRRTINGSRRRPRQRCDVGGDDVGARALRAVVEEVFSTLTMQQVTERLDAADIASAHRKTVQQFWEHPQHSARDRWRSVDSPAGPIAALKPVIILDGVEAHMGAVPALGQHTEAILSGLGYTAEQIRELRAATVV